MLRRKARESAVKAMAHQKVSMAHDDTVDAVYDVSDGGTGKTFVRVVKFAERRRKKSLHWGRALVLAPRTLLRVAWQHDFMKFAPDMKLSVADAKNREEAFEVDADAYITNHDAVKWLMKKPPTWWAKMNFTELIIDEPTAFKHYTSQRSRAAAKIVHKLAAKTLKKKAGLTATPNSNGICDVWHQIHLLDGGKRLGPSFFGFRSSVCKPVRVGRHVHAVEWRDKDGAEEAVFGLLSDIVIRHKLDDCTDIPATHVYSLPYELPKALRKAYDQLELTQLMMLATSQVTTKLRGGNPGAPIHMPKAKIPIPGPTMIAAINAASVATKLLQTCSGAIYDNEHKFHLLDTERYEMTLDLVEAREHSLVFFQWTHQKAFLCDAADKRGLKFAVLDGTTPDKERKAIVDAYQQGMYQTIFAHPKTAAHGLTLTRGTATIWPSPIYDLELWQQGNMRQRRIGQKQKTEVIMIIAPDTIEDRVYQLLMGKHARMTNLLELFESMAKEKGL